MSGARLCYCWARGDAWRLTLRERRRADITRDPAFRAQFHAMCSAAGVDPLASNKGFWAEMLGFGDFYYELGVQIGAQTPHAAPCAPRPA